jgi:hypothetical protein
MAFNVMNGLEFTLFSAGCGCGRLGATRMAEARDVRQVEKRVGQVQLTCKSRSVLT